VSAAWRAALQAAALRMTLDSEHRLLGKWKCTTIVEDQGSGGLQTEIVEIERAVGNRVYGKVSSQEPDMSFCVCRLEGIWNELYLQMLWFPDIEDGSRDLVDYGCYFFEHQPNGSYKGYAVGFFWNQGRVATYRQTLSRIRES
jgi:hypothetical protein